MLQLFSPHAQIKDRLSDLRQEGSNLQDTWQNQKDRLDQVLEFQLFLRDTKNIDAMSGAHEVRGRVGRGGRDETWEDP